MHIQHKDEQNRGMFFIEEDGSRVAALMYASGGEGTIIIEHTEVDEALQGRNIGFELVHKTVEFARTQGLKISPVCRFAKAVFDKRADFKDVLQPFS
ncbi:MAG TPA: GNAT family N-acetyltransferase [Flavisolibacter sp.]|nr:GNAT family N-acetyltransferase [Flavisolibacter sp.]